MALYTLTVTVSESGKYSDSTKVTATETLTRSQSSQPTGTLEFTLSTPASTLPNNQNTEEKFAFTTYKFADNDTGATTENLDKYAVVDNWGGSWDTSSGVLGRTLSIPSSIINWSSSDGKYTAAISWSASKKIDTISHYKVSYTHKPTSYFENAGRYYTSQKVFYNGSTLEDALPGSVTEFYTTNPPRVYPNQLNDTLCWEHSGSYQYMSDKPYSTESTQRFGVYSAKQANSGLTTGISHSLATETGFSMTSYLAIYTNQYANAGMHALVVTASDTTGYGASSITYTYYQTLTKIAGYIGTAPTAKTGLVYDGTSKQLINAGSGASGTIMYKLGSSGSYSSTLPSATNAGTYTVYYYVYASTNYNATSEQTISVTIARKQHTISLNPSTTPITLTQPASSYGPVTVSATGNYSVSSSSSNLTVARDGNAFTVNASSPISAEQQTQYSGTISASVADDNNNIGASAAISITVKSGTIGSTATGGSQTYDGQPHTGKITLPAAATIKYQFENDSTYTVINGVVGDNYLSGKAITDVGTETINYRVENTGYTTEKGTITLNVTEADYTLTINSYSGTYDGYTHGLIAKSSVPGVLVTVTDGSATYNTTLVDANTDYTLSPTKTNAGTSSMTWSATKSNYVNKNGSASITINKANISPYIIPTAANPNYSGSAQPLAIHGTTVSGCKFQYSMDGTNYSDLIPERTEVGMYTVYWKHIADNNHNQPSQSSGSFVSTLSKLYSIYFKVNGEWKLVSSLHKKQSNNWKMADGIYAKVAGNQKSSDTQ